MFSKADPVRPQPSSLSSASLRRAVTGVLPLFLSLSRGSSTPNSIRTDSIRDSSAPNSIWADSSHLPRLHVAASQIRGHLVATARIRGHFVFAARIRGHFVATARIWGMGSHLLCLGHYLGAPSSLRLEPPPLPRLPSGLNLGCSPASATASSASAAARIHHRVGSSLRRRQSRFRSLGSSAASHFTVVLCLTSQF